MWDPLLDVTEIEFKKIPSSKEESTESHYSYNVSLQKLWVKTSE